MLMADNLSNEGVQHDSLNANAVELFSINDGVQIFFITPEGYVSAPSYPSALGIYRLQDRPTVGASNVVIPPAFLKIGDWTYPLVPGRSPVLHADWGAYIFPDVTASASGSSVGVIIPDTISAEERETLEDVLGAFTDMRTQQLGEQAAAAEASQRALLAGEDYDSEEDVEEASRTSRRISEGIITVAEWLAWGLKEGAEKTGVLLKKGSAKLQEQLQPEEEQTKIDPKAQKGVYYAKQATGCAVKVSGFIVDALGKATMALGRQVAPHIRKHGEKLVPDSLKSKSGDGRSKMDDVMEVAAGGLKGFGTVYLALEHSATVLAKNIADETVHVVNHKYGKDAGNFTHNTLYATGNAAVTAYNASHLGVKAVAKRAAKDAGKAVVEDYSSKEKDPKGAGAKAGTKDQGLYEPGTAPKDPRPRDPEPL